MLEDQDSSYCSTSTFNDMAAPGVAALPPKGLDISHLIDSKCFHPLPVYNPPQPFPLAPPAEIANDIDALYNRNFYKHAAELARKKIGQIPAQQVNTDAAVQQKLFYYWTVRQTSLLLCRLGTIAREEARYLGELGSDRYRLPSTGECVVPWRLRLIVVRVQSGGDTQSGIAKYYSLAREARVEISRLRKKIVAEEDETKKSDLKTELQLWERRLRNLGLFTSSMLLGTHDTKSALALLTSMHSDSEKLQSVQEEYKEFTHQVAFAAAMVYLQIGDTISAREWFRKIEGNEFLQSLGLGVCAIADSDWEAAENILNTVSASVDAEKETLAKISVNNNLGVAKIYRGKLNDAISLLEELTEQGMISSALLVNLSILYDLRQEIGKKAKTQLLHVLKEKGYQALETYEFL